ncbi:trypsin-like serine protease [Actinoplanes sp. Pm04-4]|uniref:Trypsin-like serine protease n=1 Tax=Paractinoplanes pyxinae TaxID=2997416 RepID=A0ABT4AQW5_9ACTN|nr:trypsin-like serine protease [Actinoplanes pyxinae]MCY1136577.1 trypsin-like serine protease [Actinoplanes pyxinae]
MRTLKGRRAGLLAAAVASTALIGAPAYGIAGGTEAAAGAYPFVAQVAVSDSFACTGSLVAPQWIVTAADCFGPGATDRPAQPTTVTIGRSSLAANATGRVRAVTSLVRHPGGAVVLARLDAPVTDITPVTIATAPPTAGETLRSAGYGRTATTWIPGTLSTADFAVDTVADAAIDVTPSGDVSTCKGDAGGPLFRAGTPAQLVALNAASWQGGCLGESETRRGGTGARLDTLADWVARNTTDPYPGVISPPNPGFESGLSGWAQYGAGGNVASTERVYAGTSAVKIVDSSTSAADGVESTRMPAAPGIRYTAVAFANASSGQPDLYVRFLDASGAQISAALTTYSAAAGQWQRMSTTGFAPAGTEQVSVLLYSAQAKTTTAYFDQVELTRTPGVPLINAGFESGLTGWAQYGGGGNTVSADYAYEGINSAKIVDASTTAADGLEGTSQPAVPGVSYTATAQVTVTAGKPDLYLRFFNTAGDVVGSSATAFAGSLGRWTPIAHTATAPAGTARVSALLYYSLVNTGTAYFDQIAVARTADVAVPNHGFENGLAGWTQWGAGGNTASTERAYTGATSAKLVDTSTATATGLESVRLPAAPGVRYSGLARMFVQSGTPSIYLRFYNASGALITSTAVDHAGPANSWQWLRVAATAPAGTAEVTVLLYSKAASTGTAFADHVIVQ